MPHFPPRRRRRMVDLIRLEIVAVPAEQSRGRHNPRVVKRTMSSFPTKARAVASSRPVFRSEEHIRIVAPVGMPELRAPPAARPQQRSKRRSNKPCAPPRRGPSWLEQVQSWRASGRPRIAYCQDNGLNPRAFHQWVARAPMIFRRQSAPNPDRA
jgi:hypothetical protein